eukprot:15480076-Alexandrium_andersonii.AAC.1
MPCHQAGNREAEPRKPASQRHAPKAALLPACSSSSQCLPARELLTSIERPGHCLASATLSCPSSS